MIASLSFQLGIFRTSGASLPTGCHHEHWPSLIRTYRPSSVSVVSSPAHVRAISSSISLIVISLYPLGHTRPRQAVGPENLGQGSACLAGGRKRERRRSGLDRLPLAVEGQALARPPVEDLGQPGRDRGGTRDEARVSEQP